MLWGVSILSKFQLPSFMVFDLWYLEDWEEKAHGLNTSINDNGVCKTVPATQGLLKISLFLKGC